MAVKTGEELKKLLAILQDFRQYGVEWARRALLGDDLELLLNYLRETGELAELKKSGGDGRRT